VERGLEYFGVDLVVVRHCNAIL